MANEDLDHINERLRSIESNVRRMLNNLDMKWEEPTATDGVPDDVVELVKSGDLIAAIQQYREHTGCSLGEAKAIVGGITP